MNEGDVIRLEFPPPEDKADVVLFDCLVGWRLGSRAMGDADWDVLVRSRESH